MTGIDMHGEIKKAGSMAKGKLNHITGREAEGGGEGGDSEADAEKAEKAEKVPRCEQTTCAQCHTEGACYQDASEAYDADGDGKIQDHEGGGFYCEECWTGVYGVPPKKAPPRSKEGACAQCQTSTRCYQDANEAYVRRATLSVLGPIILYTRLHPLYTCL